MLETRYKEKINSFLKDIKKIKKESYDKNNGIGDNTFYNKTKDIILNLNKQFIVGNIYIFDILSQVRTYYKKYNLKEKLPITYNLIEKYSSSDIKINFSIYHLMTLVERFMGIEYYVYLLKNKDKYERADFDFLKNFNEVKNYFNASTSQFNEFFFMELKRKIDNMLYYVILKIKNEEENSKGFFGSLFNLNIITTKDIAKSYYSLNLRLRNLYENPPSDFEKKYIYKSLKSKWYKCPNSHFYTYEELENYNNVLSCPHCTFGEKTFTLVKKLFGM